MNGILRWAAASSVALLAVALLDIPALAAQEIPPHLKARGQEGNDLLRKGFLDVTLYDGWEGNRVDPTGVRDSTKALQKAIEDARDCALAAFFPTGTYKVSDTLSCMKKVWWHKRHKIWANWERRRAVVLVGSTRGARPVIGLTDRCPGFDDPQDPKAVVHIWNQFWPRDGKTPDQGTPPPTRLEIKNNPRGAMNGFDQQFRGIDIHVGRDNPGAVGLAFTGAQGANIEDCRIVATGGFAGFWNLPGRAMGAGNIEVEGGRYGIYIAHGPPSPVAVGVTLTNQTERALYIHKEWTPVVLVGFRIVKERAPVFTMRNGVCKVGGTAVLVDGRIEIKKPGGRAVENDAQETLYMRNVYISGADEAVKSGAGPAVKCSGRWTRIREYSYCNPKTSYNLIDGEVSRREIVSVQTASPPPPRDLVARHVWDRLPSFEDRGAKCVKDPDIGATGDGKTDDAPALQKAIDSHEKVFLPRGTYMIGETLVLRKHTKLFGSAKAHVNLSTHPDWRPTTETPMVTTVDAADATTYLGDMNLGYHAGDPQYDYFNCVTWRAGRRSVVKSIETRQGGAWGKGQETNRHRLIVITGSGGGRWYFWPQHSGGRYACRHPDYRLMAIENTHEPLSFYGFNPEHSRSTPEIEIKGARNVRIFAVKVESSPDVMHIINSRNIMVLGHGGHHARKGTQKTYFVKDSTDVVLAVIGASSYHKEAFAVFEQIDGASRYVSRDHVVALYKRGEVDDGAWSHR